MQTVESGYSDIDIVLSVDTLATLRQLAMSSQQTLSPAFIRALIKDKGVCILVFRNDVLTHLHRNLSQ